MSSKKYPLVITFCYKIRLSKCTIRQSMESISNYSNSQCDCPVGQQTDIRKFGQLFLAAADPFTHSLDAVRLGALVRAAAAAGGGEQPGASLGEPRLGGGQEEQHQYQTPRQQRDANAGRKHCPSAGSHLSCTPASSHPISPPWSFQRGVSRARSSTVIFQARGEWESRSSSTQRRTRTTRSLQKYSAPLIFQVSRYVMAARAHNSLWSKRLINPADVCPSKRL